ncbi:MAG: hypothetical protein MZV70_73340 [Desulfobacterales bacterium]|nr:hypothetical protein [Desulfobacterales bacterium]
MWKTPREGSSRSMDFPSSGRPVMERTELFLRGIGDETDVVEKQMYTFTDKCGDSVTLRPEATACVLRAVIEHGLLNKDPISQALQHRAHVPLREAPEGPVPPVPPDQCRASRRGRPPGRCRDPGHGL